MLPLLKFAPLFVLAASAAFCSVSPQNKTNMAPEGSFEPVAVIELFTSQGCSSCPSADRLLSKTIEAAQAKGEKIFALSYHVDYWNRLGWADPFSNEAFSQRQYEYVSKLRLNGAYTPQAIVNGSYEFVGSDAGALSKAISKSLNTSTSIHFKTLSTEFMPGKSVKVKFATEGNYVGATLNFALVSLSEITQIKRGENSGLTLKNENVVRQLRTQIFSTAGEIEFSTSPGLSAKNTAVIAFIQDKKNYNIIGAAITSF